MSEAPNSPLNIDLGASAKLSVEVRANIPSEALGRLVDSITSLLSPWSERRALKADLIRLHREDVAFEIARRAAERLRVQSETPRPVPLKILIPILERGSQEDIDDSSMIDMWARLLASAATTPGISPRYISVLSDLTASEADLLTKITRRKYFLWEGVDPGVRGPSEMLDSVRDEPPTSVIEELMTFFGFDRTYLAFGALECTTDQGKRERIEVKDPLIAEASLHSLEVLESLNLIRYKFGKSTCKGRYIKSWYLGWYQTTLFANMFMDHVMPEHPNYE